MRPLVLIGCFAAGSGAGAWLGLVTAFVSGLTSANPTGVTGETLAEAARLPLALTRP